ncbi:extracellular solute-binding protein [Leptothoe sp. PORK10 BA2]|uniref:extracellular solute-binding protein n=1 Tax=Leptothoe sp. PORK10 BA2 TaxID=3110254 RepID=UPI002B1FAB4C|nr:extracellular solute-binding protein [Leptothoe sp. PORK10 BA2]MEA5462250.1 extracellular solute-binding protein [Leptothoe sp. PORK10 BA2]
MVKRRTVLWGLLGGAIASCRPSPSFPLKVKLLARSVPSQVLKAFNREIPAQFEAASTLVDIYQQLQRWQSALPAEKPLWRRLIPMTANDAEAADAQTVDTHLVTLSDPWLDYAIQQKLIQPLPALPFVERLPESWQRLLRRDLAGQSSVIGELWAVPYRVQGLMIAYQKSMFKANPEEITKWADLWRPELAGRIAMPNQPRLVAAIVLKALGYSVNDEAALAQDDVQEQLMALYRQVRVFDSEDHLKALVNEDVWLAVGWSGDILATLVRYRKLGAVHPQEGTVLTTDLWVAPANADFTEATQAWIEFCWQAPMATQISVSTYGLSPLFFLPGAKVPEQLPQQTLLLPEHSEVLLPLSDRGQTLLSELFNVDVLRE